MTRGQILRTSWRVTYDWLDCKLSLFTVVNINVFSLAVSDENMSVQRHVYIHVTYGGLYHDFS